MSDEAILTWFTCPGCSELASAERLSGDDWRFCYPGDHGVTINGTYQCPKTGMFYEPEPKAYFADHYEVMCDEKSKRRIGDGVVLCEGPGRHECDTPNPTYDNVTYGSIWRCDCGRRWRLGSWKCWSRWYWPWPR